MASDVRLVANGRKYGGWKTVQVTRSLETAAGSFSLDVTDRWGTSGESWRIAEEDECKVEIDGEPVIVGHVDRRRIRLSGHARELHYSGRDATAVLVDCSAMPGQWSYRDASALDIARKVCEPFGIPVSAQRGLSLPKQRKVALNPGETAWSVIDRVARAAGVLAVSDGADGLLLTRAGTERAAPLVEGRNLLDASVDYDGSNRFAAYVVRSQIPGSDNASGDALRVSAVVNDEGVRRGERVTLLQPDVSLTAEQARRHGDWTARVRAARAEAVSVTVHGWRQPDGRLWRINTRSRVSSPSLGVDGDMLISQVGFTLSEGSGETTRLRLVRPDAYLPDPRGSVAPAAHVEA